MDEKQKLTLEDLQALNLQRSTGSLADPDRADLGDRQEEPAADPQQAGVPFPKVVSWVQEKIAQEQGGIGSGKGYKIIRGTQGQPDSIFLEKPEYDIELDPSKPEFNQEKWAAFCAMAQLPASVQEEFTQSLSQMIGAALEKRSPEEYMAAIAGSIKKIEAIEERAYNAIAAIAAIDAAFPNATDLLAGESAANAFILESMAEPAATAFSNALSAAVDAAETMQLVLRPDFLTRLQNTILNFTGAFSQEELSEIQAQFKSAEEVDENQLSLFEEPKDPARRKIAAAREEGALVSFRKAAFATTDTLLMALTRESIFMLPNETDLQEFDEHGQISRLSFTKRPPQQIETAQTGLFGAMLWAVLESYTPETQENNTVNIYVPKLLEDLHIEARPYKRAKQDNISMKELRYQKMLELLQPFDRWIGQSTDGSFFRFLTIESYNPEAETMRITAPYLFELVRKNDQRRYTFLAHPDIANERNQAAVEIAMRLLQGLQKRGTTNPDTMTYKSMVKPKKRTTKIVDPDGTKTTVIDEYQEEQEIPDPNRPAVFTYEYSYKNIIRDCPQIRYELQKIDQRTGPQAKTAKQAYNAKLKQTFSAAFRILMEKTDAPEYYKNLHFTNVYPDGTIILPTKSTLNGYIGLEHNGKNKAYSREEHAGS